jgi:hypothetical protein
MGIAPFAFAIVLDLKPPPNIVTNHQPFRRFGSLDVRADAYSRHYIWTNNCPLWLVQSGQYQGHEANVLP